MLADQSNTVNLFDVAAVESVEESSLELIRLGYDETAFIPFTADSKPVHIHYCPDTEINSYVLCNGSDCVLCKIGRKRELLILLICNVKRSLKKDRSGLGQHRGHVMAWRWPPFVTGLSPVETGRQGSVSCMLSVIIRPGKRKITTTSFQWC